MNGEVLEVSAPWQNIQLNPVNIESKYFQIKYKKNLLNA